MSLLEHLEKGEQQYEAVSAAMSKAQLPLEFSTKAGLCTIVGRDDLPTFRSLRIDIYSLSMPDDLQVADMIFCQFHVTSPPKEIVSFMDENLLGIQHGIQVATMIIGNTQMEETRWTKAQLDNTEKAVHKSFPDAQIS